ncbi:MAG TPA: inositol monophosphatase family protein, partial [Gammaproteobacteria bacterium]|nr:inositol monophosphatase family protein [Gammaproteobacteria bacterium]
MTDETRSEGPDPCQYLDAVNALARDAGRRILEVYHTDFEVEQKDDRSPLTAADMAAHNAIVAGLQVIDPDIPMLSEESSGVPFAERSQWNRYWLIDPLDGTREFVKRNGEFTVNIALIQNGEPLLGVVHVPVSGVSYYGCAGQGAYRQNADQAPQPIHVREHAGEPLMVAGSRSHAGDSLKRFLGNLGKYEIISM